VLFLLISLDELLDELDEELLLDDDELLLDEVLFEAVLFPSLAASSFFCLQDSS